MPSHRGIANTQDMPQTAKALENNKRKVEKDKRRKQQHDVQVQGTNNSSIMSKRLVEALYTPIVDPHHGTWFDAFVGKAKRRSPAINRGYWIRMETIKQVVGRIGRKYVECGKRVRVVNLGCGFDPLPFQGLAGELEDVGVPANMVDFVDFDYPDLVARKLGVIEGVEKLTGVVGKSRELSDEDQSLGVVMATPQYMLIGCDLKNHELYRKQLNHVVQGREGYGTIFIAEVSLAYMEAKDADRVAAILAEISASHLVVIEQMMPVGRKHFFADKMVRHFHKLGLPIQCVEVYPTREDQIQRFSKMFSKVEAEDLFYCWNHLISRDRRRKVQSVEFFDEWEEFIVFCQHYVVIQAGEFTVFEPERSLERDGESQEFTDSPGFIEHSRYFSDSKAQEFNLFREQIQAGSEAPAEKSRTDVNIRPYGAQERGSSTRECDSGGEIKHSQSSDELTGIDGHKNEENIRTNGFKFEQIEPSRFEESNILQYIGPGPELKFTAAADPAALAAGAFKSTGTLADGSAALAAGAANTADTTDAASISSTSAPAAATASADTSDVAASADTSDVAAPTAAPAAAPAANAAVAIAFGGLHQSRSSSLITFPPKTPIPTDSNPTARMCHTLTNNSQNELILCGGRTRPDDILSDVWAFNLKSLQWRRLPDVPIPLYRHLALCLSPGRVLIIGDGHFFEISNDTIRELPASISLPRLRSAAVTLCAPNLGYILGGITEDSAPEISSTLYSFTVTDNLVTVNAIWNSFHFSRIGAMAAFSKGSLFLVGGVAPKLLGAKDTILAVEVAKKSIRNVDISSVWDSAPLFIGASLAGNIIVGGGAVCYSFGSRYNDCYSLNLDIY